MRRRLVRILSRGEPPLDLLLSILTDSSTVHHFLQLLPVVLLPQAADRRGLPSERGERVGVSLSDLFRPARSRVRVDLVRRGRSPLLLVESYEVVWKSSISRDASSYELNAICCRSKRSRRSVEESSSLLVVLIRRSAVEGEGGDRFRRGDEVSRSFVERCSCDLELRNIDGSSLSDLSMEGHGFDDGEELSDVVDAFPSDVEEVGVRGGMGAGGVGMDVTDEGSDDGEEMFVGDLDGSEGIDVPVLVCGERIWSERTAW